MAFVEENKSLCDDNLEEKVAACMQTLWFVLLSGDS